MKHLIQRLSACLAGWPVALWLLGALAFPAPALSATCSVYQGQATLNELRIGATNQTDTANQVEIYNSGNVDESVWRTWILKTYHEGSLKTTAAMSSASQFQANGQFIYNSNKALFLENRSGGRHDVEVVLTDASGAYIDYVLIGTTPTSALTPPACLSPAKKATASTSSKDKSGNLSRTTDGGNWPSTATSTSSHTIGRTNNCNASGNDLSVSYLPDQASPIVNTTTVNYTLTVSNRNCSASVSGIKLTATNISATNFNSLAYSTTTPASTGTRTLVGSNLEWSGITLAAGASATLTITGVPKLVGALSSVASISLPSGRVNTADDSDTEVINVVDYNYVGFDITTDTLLEGTDLTYEAGISTSVISTKSVTVNYTVSCPLCSGDTNLPATGSLTLPANDGTGSISFTVTDDSFYETDKTIVITITSISSADSGVRLSATNNVLTLTLQDDDYDTDTSLPTVTAEYLFDEASWSGVSGEVRDTSANARHGTASGLNSTKATTANSSRVVSGSTGTCAYGVFDRTNKQFVSLPATFPDLGSSSFTITGWIRTTDNTLSGQRIFWDDATSGSGGYALSLGDAGAGILRLYQRGAGTNINVDTASVISNNTWYFVAAVVDTTTKSRTVYVYDSAGTLLASPSSAYSAASFGSDSGAAAIGGASNTGTSGQSSSSSYGFAGNLDEMRVYPAALTPAKLGAVRGLTRACASYAPHHYELSMPSTGLACLPSTVTVTACAGSTSPCSSAYTSGNGTTATLTSTGGTLGSGSLTFNASGVATTTLSYPSATDGASATVTLSAVSAAASSANQCCPSGASCTATSTCSATFNTAGLIYSSSANGSNIGSFPAQVAGTSSGTYYLRAVQTNTTTKACESALSGAQQVQWGLVCVNPATCSSSNLMSITGSGSATAIANNANGPASSFTNVAMTFDANGNAPFSFTYNDAGRVRLDSKITVNSATLSGINTSSSHVTRPASFSISNIRQTSTSTANPAAASANGSKFVKAGESFSATVTALTSGGAATPNFGNENTPEGVTLSANLVLPSGGTSGTLSNGSIPGTSFANGAATVTNLAYSEVGIITLTPSLTSASYITTGGTPSGTTSGNVGRFYPAQFALSGGTVTHRSGSGCSPASAFTYLGENFTLGFTLTAQNTAGGTTANYTSSSGFAKLDAGTAANWNLAGLGGSTTFSTGSGRLSLGSSTAGSGFAAGVATVSLVAQATRAAIPDGPFGSAQFGISPQDSDGVTMTTLNMASTSGGSSDKTSVATVPLRFGRLRLSNAVGSQSRALSLPITAQYWNGSAFDTNTLDSCTTVSSTHVNFGNLRRTLTTADTAVSGSSFTLSSGVGGLKLAAPLGGRYGTVDVALSLGITATDASCLQPWTPAAGDVASAGANLTFLRGAWCGSSYGSDPSARASFGLYGGSDAMVFQRENY